MKTDINKLSNRLDQYAEFIDNQNRVPKITGDKHEVTLYNWAVATVAKYRAGNFNGEAIELIKSKAPSLYNRCVNNTRDFDTKVDKFMEWCFEHRRFPSGSGDEEEQIMYTWICNIRRSYNRSDIPDEHIKKLNKSCPILLNSNNPAKDFKDWVIKELINKRRAEAEVNLDSLNLNNNQLEFFLDMDLLNIWDIYMRLIDEVNIINKYNMSMTKYKQIDLNSKIEDFGNLPDNVISAYKFIRTCDDNLIFEIFQMLDPDIQFGEYKILCRIFDHGALILASDRIRVSQISKRLRIKLLDLNNTYPRYVEVLIKRYYAGYTFDEIGNYLKLSKEIARLNEHNAIRWFKERHDFLSGYTKLEHPIVDAAKVINNSIEDMGLSVRAYNVLHRAGIDSKVKLHYLIQLKGEDAISRIRGAGTKVVDEVLEKYSLLDKNTLDTMANMGDCRNNSYEIGNVNLSKYVLLPINIEDDSMCIKWFDLVDKIIDNEG